MVLQFLGEDTPVLDEYFNCAQRAEGEAHPQGREGVRGVCLDLINLLNFPSMIGMGV